MRKKIKRKQMYKIKRRGKKTSIYINQFKKKQQNINSSFSSSKWKTVQIFFLKATHFIHNIYIYNKKNTFKKTF